MAPIERLSAKQPRLQPVWESSDPASPTSSREQPSEDTSSSAAAADVWDYPAESCPEGATEIAKSVAETLGRCVVMKDAPAYLHRSFIHTGYYVGGTHPASAFSTLFSWNNETLNAWTIVMGVWVTLAGIIYARRHLPEATAPVALMVASALPHSPWSIALHCCIGVSERTRDFLRTMDVFFILTCSVPRGLALAWYVLHSSTAYWIYAALITAGWCFSVASICVLRRVKDLPKAVLARDVAFIVLCYIAPVGVGAVAELRKTGFGLCTLYFVGMLGALYMAAWCYAHHLPERWYPGRFDHVGNSHQIMHVLVVVEYTLEWLFVIHLARQHHIAILEAVQEITVKLL